MPDDASLLAELLQHMPVDVRSRPPEERRSWLQRAARHLREERQKEAAARAFRDAVRTEYPPLHSELFELRGWRTKPPELAELGPGVFAFEIVPPGVCGALLEELAHIERWAQERGLSITRPNSMNRYGLILDDVGFKTALDEMMHRSEEHTSELQSLRH